MTCLPILRGDRMAMLEERIAREEARGEQQDTRLSELRDGMQVGFDRTDRAIANVREDMRSGFERTDRAIADVREDMRSGFERTDQAIEGLRSEFNSFRNVTIGGLITLGIGMVVLFLTIFLRPPS